MKMSSLTVFESDTPPVSPERQQLLQQPNEQQQPPSTYSSKRRGRGGGTSRYSSRRSHFRNRFENGNTTTEHKSPNHPLSSSMRRKRRTSSSSSSHMSLKNRMERSNYVMFHEESNDTDDITTPINYKNRTTNFRLPGWNRKHHPGLIANPIDKYYSSSSSSSSYQLVGINKASYDSGMNGNNTNDSDSYNSGTSESDDSFFLPRQYSIPPCSIEVDGTDPSVLSSYDGGDIIIVDDLTTTSSTSESEDFIDDFDRFDGAILKRNYRPTTPLDPMRRISAGTVDDNCSTNDVGVYNNTVGVTGDLNNLNLSVGKLETRRIPGSTSNSVLRKLRPPKSSVLLVSPASRRQQRIRMSQEASALSNYYTDNNIRLVHNVTKGSFERMLRKNLSRSFDTADTTDDDDNDEEDDDDDEEEDYLVTCSLLSSPVITPSTLSSYRSSSDDNNNNTTKSRLSNPYHNIRWSDECGQQLEVIHDLEVVQEETCRIIIVLMNAPVAPYEFLHCEFQTQPRLKVHDILTQLPILRKQQQQHDARSHSHHNHYYSHVANDNNENEIKYSALCVLGKELINMLAIQDYFCIGEDASEYTLRDGLIFLAVRQGCSSKDVIIEGDQLLTNKSIRRAIRRTRIAGRRLQSLKSSAELQKLASNNNNQQQQYPSSTMKGTKKKQQRAATKKSRKAAAAAILATNHEQSREATTIGKVIVEVEVLSDLDRIPSLCSSIDDSDFSCTNFNLVNFEKFEKHCPSAFVDARCDDISRILWTDNGGNIVVDHNHQPIELYSDTEGSKFCSLSISDSADMMERLLETLLSRPRNNNNNNNNNSNKNEPTATDIVDSYLDKLNSTNKLYDFAPWPHVSSTVQDIPDFFKEPTGNNEILDTDSNNTNHDSDDIQNLFPMDALK